MIDNTKSSKSFLTISKAECLITYKEVLSNSNKKWDSAILLGKNKDYATAASIAIISMEELVKSLIILADGKGFRFRRIKGMDIMFKNHSIRYLVSYFMSIFGVFGDELSKFIIKCRDNPNDIYQMNKNITLNKNFYDKEIAEYFKEKLILIIKELEWFSKMDVLRQDGFYSDYSNEFKNPINISEENFIEIINRLESVRKAGNYFIEILNSEDADFKKQLQEINNKLIKDKLYDKIGDKLRAIKQDGNMFTAIFSSLTTFMKNVNNNDSEI